MTRSTVAPTGAASADMKRASDGGFCAAGARAFGEVDR
jgi:hypothetical protein